MAKLGIIWYPRKILRQKAQRVSLEELRSKEFLENISQMWSIMYYRGGVGLSAPQVGWDARVFVANPSGRPLHNSHARVFINPSIVGLGETVIEQEGCLSFPGLYASVERNKAVSIRYASTSKDGIEEVHDGFMARIIQHEYDHLNGVLFIDRLTEEVKEKIKPKLQSHRERIKRIRKKREKKKKEEAARKKKKTEKRRKQRKKKKGK